MSDNIIKIDKQYPIKLLKSCFLCDVNFYKDYIVVIDSRKVEYFIMLSDADAISTFKFWFENVYMKGIAQVLTIIDYKVMPTEDGDSFFYVNKLIANPNFKNEVSMLNEAK